MKFILGNDIRTPMSVPSVPNIQIRPKSTPNQLEFWWQPPSSVGGSAITGYTLSCRNPVLTYTYGPRAVYAAITGLVNGQTYAFVLTATNSTGTGPPAAFRVVDPGLPSSEPTDVVVTRTSNGSSLSALFTWNQPAPVVGACAIGWYLVKATPSIGPPIVQATYGFSRSKLLQGLNPSTTYRYEVQAISNAGYSVPAVKGPPGAPVNLTAIPGPTSATLSWTAPITNGGTITNYQYSIGGSFIPFTPDVSGTTATITGLTNGVTYTIALQAVNEFGAGNSTSTTVVPGQTPGKPYNLVQGATTTSTIDIAWTIAPIGPTSYTFTVNSIDWTTRTLVNGTSALITDLSGGNTYSVVVTAHSGSSISSDPFIVYTVPNPPTNVAVTTLLSTSTTIGWTNPIGSWSNILFTTTPTATVQYVYPAASATLTVTPGTQYSVGLRSVFQGRNSAPANIQFTSTAVPGAPVLSQVVAGSGTAALTWVIPASNGSPIANYQYATDVSGLNYTAFSPPQTGSSATISGLTNGTQYYIRIKAVNGVGASAPSNMITVTPVGGATAPSTPTGLTATPGNATATINWSPVNNGGSPITAYEYSFTNVSPTYLPFSPPISGAATSGIITGLNNGTSYTIYVRATNSIGSSNLSAGVTFTPNVEPSAPQNFTAVRGNQRISLGWTAPATGSPFTNYLYSTNGTTYTAFSPAITTSPASIDLSGLTNGTAYTVSVKAANALFPSGGAATSSIIVTPATVPDAPTGVGATAGNTQATISWMAPNNGGSPIIRYQYTLNDLSYNNFTPDASGTQGIITGLTNGTLYNVKVRAVNSVNPGAGSASVTVTPTAGATAPGIPTNVSAVAGNTQATISWTAPSNGGSPITRYQYTLNDLSYNNFTPDASGTQGIITGLTNGTLYNVKVRANNSIGSGLGSASVSVRPNVAPSAPRDFTAVRGNQLISLGWTVPLTGAPITNYLYSTDGTAYTAFSPAITASPASIDLSGLTNGTAYTVSVKAANALFPSGGTATASISVTPATVPDTPTGLTATPGDSRATINWSAVNNGGSTITRYQYAFTNISPTYLNFNPDVSGAATSGTITGLTNGQSATVYVRAVNAVGNGLPSVGVTFTPSTTPGQPLDLSGVGGNGMVQITWTAGPTNGAPITNYAYSTDASGLTYTEFVPPVTGTIGDISGLVNGTPYQIRLRAKNINGLGAPAGPISITPTNVVSVPGQPTNVVLTPGDGDIGLFWTPPFNGGAPITNYEYATDASGLIYTAFNPVRTGSVAVIRDLSNGTLYTIRIRAVNSAGSGTPSAPQTATPRLLITGITPDINPPIAGQLITYTVDISGISSVPYTDVWIIEGEDISSNTNGSLAYSVAQAGQYTLTYSRTSPGGTTTYSQTFYVVDGVGSSIQLSGSSVNQRNVVNFKPPAAYSFVSIDIVGGNGGGGGGGVGSTTGGPAGGGGGGGGGAAYIEGTYTINEAITMNIILGSNGVGGPGGDPSGSIVGGPGSSGGNTILTILGSTPLTLIANGGDGGGGGSSSPNYEGGGFGSGGASTIVPSGFTSTEGQSGTIGDDGINGGTGGPGGLNGDGVIQAGTGGNGGIPQSEGNPGSQGANGSSGTYNVTFNLPPPTITAIISDTDIPLINANVRFTAEISGNYSGNDTWSINGEPLASNTDGSFNHVFPTAGAYLLTYTIFPSSGTITYSQTFYVLGNPGETMTFNGSSSIMNFRVPPGYTYGNIQMTAGSGGGGGGGDGGAGGGGGGGGGGGAYVHGPMVLIEGSKLNIEYSGSTGTGGEAGYNGAGESGNNGADITITNAPYTVIAGGGEGGSGGTDGTDGGPEGAGGQVTRNGFPDLIDISGANGTRGENINNGSNGGIGGLAGNMVGVGGTGGRGTTDTTIAQPGTNGSPASFTFTLGPPYVSIAATPDPPIVGSVTRFEASIFGATYQSDTWYLDGASVATDTSGILNRTFMASGQYLLGYSVTTPTGVLDLSQTIYVVAASGDPIILTSSRGPVINFNVPAQYGDTNSYIAGGSGGGGGNGGGGGGAGAAIQAQSGIPPGATINTYAGRGGAGGMTGLSGESSAFYLAFPGFEVYYEYPGGGGGQEGPSGVGGLGGVFVEGLNGNNGSDGSGTTGGLGGDVSGANPYNLGGGRGGNADVSGTDGSGGIFVLNISKFTLPTIRSIQTDTTPIVNEIITFIPDISGVYVGSNLWLVNGGSVPGNTGQEFEYVFDTSGAYDITLTLNTPVGFVSYTQTFYVVNAIGDPLIFDSARDSLLNFVVPAEYTQVQINILGGGGGGGGGGGIMTGALNIGYDGGNGGGGCRIVGLIDISGTVNCDISGEGDGGGTLGAAGMNTPQGGTAGGNGGKGGDMVLRINGVPIIAGGGGGGGGGSNYSGGTLGAGGNGGTGSIVLGLTTTAGDSGDSGGSPNGGDGGSGGGANSDPEAGYPGAAATFLLTFTTAAPPPLPTVSISTPSILETGNNVITADISGQYDLSESVWYINDGQESTNPQGITFNQPVGQYLIEYKLVTTTGTVRAYKTVYVVQAIGDPITLISQMFPVQNFVPREEYTQLQVRLIGGGGGGGGGGSSGTAFGEDGTAGGAGGGGCDVSGAIDISSATMISCIYSPPNVDDGGAPGVAGTSGASIILSIDSRTITAGGGGGGGAGYSWPNTTIAYRGAGGTASGNTTGLTVVPGIEGAGGAGGAGGAAIGDDPVQPGLPGTPGDLASYDLILIAPPQYPAPFTITPPSQTIPEGYISTDFVLVGGGGGRSIDTETKGGGSGAVVFGRNVPISSANIVQGLVGGLQTDGTSTLFGVYSAFGGTAGENGGNGGAADEIRNYVTSIPGFNGATSIAQYNPINTTKSSYPPYGTGGGWSIADDLSGTDGTYLITLNPVVINRIIIGGQLPTVDISCALSVDISGIYGYDTDSWTIGASTATDTNGQLTHTFTQAGPALITYTLTTTNATYTYSQATWVVDGSTPISVTFTNDTFANPFYSILMPTTFTDLSYVLVAGGGGGAYSTGGGGAGGSGADMSANVSIQGGTLISIGGSIAGGAAGTQQLQDGTPAAPLLFSVGADLYGIGGGGGGYSLVQAGPGGRINTYPNIQTNNGASSTSSSSPPGAFGETGVGSGQGGAASSVPEPGFAGRYSITLSRLTDPIITGITMSPNPPIYQQPTTFTANVTGNYNFTSNSWTIGGNTNSTETEGVIVSTIGTLGQQDIVYTITTSTGTFSYTQTFASVTTAGEQINLSSSIGSLTNFVIPTGYNSITYSVIAGGGGGGGGGGFTTDSGAGVAGTGGGGGGAGGDIADGFSVPPGTIINITSNIPGGGGGQGGADATEEASATSGADGTDGSGATLVIGGQSYIVTGGGKGRGGPPADLSGGAGGLGGLGNGEPGNSGNAGEGSQQSGAGGLGGIIGINIVSGGMGGSGAQAVNLGGGGLGESGVPGSFAIVLQSGP